jgi:hypothetical protein
MSLFTDSAKGEITLPGEGRMRKEIVGPTTAAGKTQHSAEWLDLDSIARVQLTSEDPAFPIENALSLNPEVNELGWRAAGPGAQTITLVFDAGHDIHQVRLHIIDHTTERSQELLLRYSSATETDREIVRQQWSFSPTGSTQEVEEYSVDLRSVTKLELVIDPDRGRRNSVAVLNALRLA